MKLSVKNKIPLEWILKNVSLEHVFGELLQQNLTQTCFGADYIFFVCVKAETWLRRVTVIEVYFYQMLARECQ